jgi:DNA-binding NarL/FixJ family response regulator
MNLPRIIVVDDSPLVRTMLQELLNRDYAIVASVGDGQAAVEAVQQLSPELVLLDISMPILNGFEAARQIKRLCPSTLLLFISEHRERVYADGAFEAGGAGFVVKSKIVSELRPAIREVLAGGQYGRPPAPGTS